MPVQYFLLDSNAVGYAAALAALANYDAGNYSFTPTQTVRDFAANSDLKIVKANITEAELNADGDLVDLRAANFPTELCRHRFADLNEFRTMGFHMLGESVRSWEGVAGRTVRFSRPQVGATASNATVGVGYGDGNGLTYYDAYNGGLDHRIADGGSTNSAEHQTGTTYYVCGTQFVHVRVGVHLDYGNPVGSSHGRMKLADATGLGDAGKIILRGDYSFAPGMLWGGSVLYEETMPDPDNPWPWVEWDAGNSIYLQSQFLTNSDQYQFLSRTSNSRDLDVDDNTLDLDTLVSRYFVRGQTSLTALEGTGGRARWFLPCVAGRTGLWLSVQQFDGMSTYTDITNAARNTGGSNDHEYIPAGAADGAGVYFGAYGRFNHIQFVLDVVQVGGTVAFQYWNGSSFTALTLVNDGTNGLTQGGTVTFVPPDDWVETTVNGTTAHWIFLAKTGGTITTAARGDWNRHSNHYSFWRVKTFDGTSSYADIGLVAGNPHVADDHELIPTGAANNSAVIWMAKQIFTQIKINLSQVRVGGTYVLEYSQGSGSWNIFATINDPSSALTSGTASQHIQFTPETDWAQDTIDGDTGYAIRLRKTGGTVTQAARGDYQGYVMTGIFFHRWNDSAPTWGLSGNGGGSLKYDFDGAGAGFGGYEVHGLRMISNGQWGDLQDCTDVSFYGSQFCMQAKMFHQTGSAIRWLAGIEGNGRTDWWSREDRRVQDDTHDIFTHAEYGLVAVHGDDPALYADIPYWSDIGWSQEGPYQNNAAPAEFVLDGVTIRHVGDDATNMAGDTVFETSGEAADHHSIGVLGGGDFSSYVIRRVGIEDFISNVFYVQGTSSGHNKPVQGSGSKFTNLLVEHGWCHTWNGTVDGSQPNFGFDFTGDNDHGWYSDGNGGYVNPLLQNWIFVDVNQPSDVSIGSAIQIGTHCPIKVRNISAVQCNNAWFMTHEWHNSIHVFVFDQSLGSYTDITANVMDTGNTATELFPSAPEADDMVIFAYPANAGGMDFEPRTARMNITTAAGGSPTLTVKYYNDTTGWVDASNVADGTSGLTTTGNLNIDHPDDYGALNINGTDYLCFGVEFTSGTMTTVPEADEVIGLSTGPQLDIADYVVWKPINGVGGSRLHATGGTGLGENTGWIKDVNCTLYYDGATQSASDDYWNWNKSWGGGGNGLPNLNSTEYQALSKPKLGSDANEDSIFGSGLTLVEAS